MHSAVLVTTGMSLRNMASARVITAILIVFLILAFPPTTHSQPGDDGSERTSGSNLPDTNLEDEAEPVRRIQRLGDVVGENEWELELTVPQGVGNLPNHAQLSDANQQKQLQALLTELADKPGEPEILNRIKQLMDDVLRQANAAIDSNEQERARELLSVVQAVSPDHPGYQSTVARLEALNEEQGRLEAARAALLEGRIDQPENNSAWFFYRQVLDQNPDNIEAQEGLLAIQQDMIRRAMDFAKAQDFDSAERLLDEASYVREGQELVEQARLEIQQDKSARAELLETRAVLAMDSGEFQAAENSLIDLIALGGQGDLVNQLRRRLEEARIYGGFKPGQIIRDHFVNSGTWAPSTVVILAGSFQMGSPVSEPGREENEGPQHRITFRRGFAIGLREVSVGEFRAFAHESGYKSDAQRNGHSIVYDQFSGRLTEKEGAYWEMDYEGNQAKPTEPVLHVSWNDAQAYVNWLARRTGKSYRLPSEAEFEYALRAGSTTRYWWGNGSPSSVVENITGERDTSRSRRNWNVFFAGYTDKYWGPAPVGAFLPNPNGLMDIGGNVAEWVRDCWHDTYVRAPVDGSAWINPGCELRVIRGGYWASSPDQTRSAYRLFAKAGYHDARVGFRVARDL